jgi:N-acetylglutamate synthase-like GNAT family acetyltransferase
MELKNLDIDAAFLDKKNSELKNLNFPSNSLELDSESISFSNCESFKDLDLLEKTEDNFNTNTITVKTNNIPEQIIWSSRLTNKQFIKIKYCFNTLFKIKYPEEFFTKILNKTYHIVTGSIKNSDVICFAILNINLRERNVEILSFGVLKEFQGRHYGTKLMQKLIEEFRSMEIKNISLVVQKTNKIAISLYEKFGFKLFEEDLNYYKILEGNERNALILKKSMELEQFWIFKVFKNISKKFML